MPRRLRPDAPRAPPQAHAAQPNAAQPAARAHAPKSAQQPRAPPPTPLPAPPTGAGSFWASLLPEGGVLPWWVILVASIYLLLKLGLFFESPCGILGIHAPITRGQVSKAFRTISTCTHPDKLVSLPGADIHRGELLFKRASDARDKLNAGLRTEDSEGSTLTCDTQLDAAIYRSISYMGSWLFETGATSMASSAFHFLWALCTFQYDLSTTISCALLLMTLFRTLQHLFSYIFFTGPITALFSMVTYSFLGPLPSLYRLVALPPLRVYCFMCCDLIPFVSPKLAETDTGVGGKQGVVSTNAASDPNVAAEEGHASEDEDTIPLPSIDALGEIEASPLVHSHVLATEPSKRRTEDASRGSGLRHRKNSPKPASSQAAETAQMDAETFSFGPPVSSLSLLQIVQRKPMADMRVAAAHHIQFELLLSTTKYVIPLATLVATGQAFNGLWSSLITAQVLHKLPALRPELQHILLLVVGAAHTLLCASKSQLNEAPAGVLQLQWTWSVHDVLAVANIMTLGAIFASASRSGNEPTFCASFAAGLSLRMAAAEFLPSSATQTLAHIFRRSNLEFVGLDEIAVRSWGTIGACGGGPFRAVLGTWGAGPTATYLTAISVKAILLVMPILAVLQWGLKSALLMKRLLKEASRQGRPKPLRSGEMLVPVLRRRLAASLVMTGAISLLICYFCSYQLNAINASLGNFLVAALTGCLFESLLATYDLQGRLRQFTFFIMFMLL